MHKVISFIPEKVGLYKITLSAAGYMGGDVSMDISTSANKVYQQDPRKVSVEFYNQDTAIIKKIHYSLITVLLIIQKSHSLKKP